MKLPQRLLHGIPINLPTAGHTCVIYKQQLQIAEYANNTIYVCTYICVVYSSEGQAIIRAIWQWTSKLTQAKWPIVIAFSSFVCRFNCFVVLLQKQTLEILQYLYYMPYEFVIERFTRKMSKYHNTLWIN